MKKLLTLLLLWASPALAQWTAPIGIPTPPASLLPDRSTPAAPGAWPGAEVTGAYYIDNTHGSCTDANTYGYPNVPRCTLPNANISFIEGGRMHLVGGGIDYVITSNRNWTSAGTEANPVVITGTLDPVIASVDDDLIQLGGTWFIIENITFEETRVIDNSAANLDNVLVRNNSIHNTLGTSGACLNFSRSADSEFNEYVVIYNNTISQCGPDFDPGVTNDIMGVQASNGARFWWIVDNHIHHVGADSVRTGTNVGGGHAANRASDIYVGRNNFHDNGENALDVKNSVRVVFSQNEMHDFPDGLDAGAEVVTVHEGAIDTALIFNRMYEGRIGINTTTSGGVLDGLYIIGNVFHDIHHYAADVTYDEDDIGQSFGNAIVLGHGSGTDCYVTNNTFFGNDRGLAMEVNVSTGCEIVNNIMGTPDGGSWGLGFENGTVHTASTITNNLFDTGTWARAQVTSTTYASLAAYVAAHPSKCADCVSGDPLFVSEGSLNFALLVDSPAIDTGTASSGAYAAYEAVFGEPITVDFLGVARPQGGVWDIGAFEFEAPGPGGSLPLWLRSK